MVNKKPCFQLSPSFRLPASSWPGTRGHGQCSTRWAPANADKACCSDALLYFTWSSIFVTACVVGFVPFLRVGGGGSTDYGACFTERDHLCWLLLAFHVVIVTVLVWLRGVPYSIVLCNNDNWKKHPPPPPSSPLPKDSSVATLWNSFSILLCVMNLARELYSLCCETLSCSPFFLICF